MAPRARVTYLDGVGPLNGAATRPRQLLQALGIRWIDAGAAALVALLVELNVVVGGGPGAAPLNAVAYVFGAALALPILVRHRWPLGSLIGCAVLLMLYYSLDRRNISPAPLLSLPLYDAAVAGYLAVAIAIPAFYMTVGLFVVDVSTHQSLVSLAAEFLPSIAVLVLAIMLGEVVRSRRALAAETADRLRLASEEREAEAGRRVAEERLRIARELHDTVAHSMATITVQAGSALHVLGPDDQAGGPDGQLRERAHRHPGDQQGGAHRDAGHARPAPPGDPGRFSRAARGRTGPAARAVRGGDGRGRPRHPHHRGAATAAPPGRGPRGLPDPAGVPDQRAAARGRAGPGDGLPGLRARGPGHPGDRRRRRPRRPPDGTAAGPPAATG